MPIQSNISKSNNTQNRITQACALLNDQGKLQNPGWSTQPHWKYTRENIAAGWHRIKEWDYYCVLSQKHGYGITFTIADLGFMGLLALCWLDLKNQRYHQVDEMLILPRGNMKLPPSSLSGDVHISGKKIQCHFCVKEDKRIIEAHCPSFTYDNQKGLSVKLELDYNRNHDSMVIATPWPNKPKNFYYNHKINCMPAHGSVQMGNVNYTFNDTHSFGNLDWGRGNWTYKNRWFWSSASGLCNNKLFGFNFGYGFSDRSAATENMLFYDGKAHKLRDVFFEFNTHDYCAPWNIKSPDDRVQLDFTPRFDRQSNTNFILLKSIQHQIFGYFDGTVVLDDGMKLEISNLAGFTEDVLNWW